MGNISSKIYVEKLLRGTIYENEGKITLNFIPVSIYLQLKIELIRRN